MGAGFPGMGIASFFYVAAALLAPIRELVRTFQGRSSWTKWTLVGRQFGLALSIVAAVVGLYIAVDAFIARGLLPAPEPIRLPGGWSNWVYAVIALVGVLYVVTIVAWFYAIWAERRGLDDDATLIAEAHRLSIPEVERIPEVAVLQGRHLAAPVRSALADDIIDLVVLEDSAAGRHLAGFGLPLRARLEGRRHGDMASSPSR